MTKTDQQLGVKWRRETIFASQVIIKAHRPIRALADGRSSFRLPGRSTGQFFEYPFEGWRMACSG